MIGGDYMMPKCIERVNKLQSDIDRIEIETEALQIQVSDLHQVIGHILTRFNEKMR